MNDVRFIYFRKLEDEEIINWANVYYETRSEDQWQCIPMEEIMNKRVIICTLTFSSRCIIYNLIIQLVKFGKIKNSLAKQKIYDLYLLKIVTFGIGIFVLFTHFHRRSSSSLRTRNVDSHQFIGGRISNIDSNCSIRRSYAVRPDCQIKTNRTSFRLNIYTHL